jgi:hypothetical protein|tara:strand:- start:239 stop:556 length:318 start_codon:yes stop_codon:yes gene_type:complete
MSEYTDDINEMILDLGVGYSLVLANGSTLFASGAINEISQGNDAGEGGFLDDFDLTLIAKKADHSILPLLGSKITIAGQKYRIEKITTTPADAAEVRFSLMSADR